MPAPGFVTLVAPPGAREGMVAHGGRGWECYRDRTNPARWLVDVPADVAPYFCNGVGGFVLLERERFLPGGGRGM
jgi:hypothetical protein